MLLLALRLGVGVLARVLMGGRVVGVGGVVGVDGVRAALVMRAWRRGWHG